MPTVQEVTSDPNFLSLSPSDKIHVMSRIDPNFASLGPDDQQHVVMKLSPVAAGAQKNLASIKAGTDVPQGALDPNQGTFMQGLKESAIPTLDSMTTLAKAATGNPIAMFDVAKNVGGAQWGEVKRAKESYVRGLHDIGEGNIAQGIGRGIEGIGHSAAAATPIIGPAAANAGEDIAQGNIARGLGKATGLIGSVLLPGAVAKGVNAVLPAAGDALRSSALNEYVKVLDPAGRNPELANEIAQRFIDEGVKLPVKNARAAVADIAEQKAAAVDTDTPIQNRAQPANPQPVLDELASQRKQLFNEVKRIPAPSEMTDAGAQSAESFRDQLKASLEKRYPMAEVVTDPGTGELVVNQIRHPSMWTKANDLSTIAKHIKDTAAGGTLTNANLRNLLQDYGYYADKGGAFEGADTNPVRLPADAHAASSLRDVVGEDPAADAALNERSRWIQAKNELAPGVSQGKPYEGGVGRLVAKSAAAGLAHLIGGPIAGKVVATVLGTAEINRFARSIMASPAWKTWSAVNKANFAQALISGDVGTAVSAAARADQAATGISDDAHAAMTHIPIRDMPKVYNGGAVYIDPDGKVTPIPEGAQP